MPRKTPFFIKKDKNKHIFEDRKSAAIDTFQKAFLYYTTYNIPDLVKYAEENKLKNMDYMYLVTYLDTFHKRSRLCKSFLDHVRFIKNQKMLEKLIKIHSWDNFSIPHLMGIYIFNGIYKDPLWHNPLFSNPLHDVMRKIHNLYNDIINTQLRHDQKDPAFMYNIKNNIFDANRPSFMEELDKKYKIYFPKTNIYDYSISARFIA